MLRDAGQADKLTDVVADAARTGRIGEGKIWVTEVARTVGIRTGDTGDDARSATF